MIYVTKLKWDKIPSDDAESESESSESDCDFCLVFVTIFALLATVGTCENKKVQTVLLEKNH